jgi:hypothetical protein
MFTNNYEFENYKLLSDENKMHLCGLCGCDSNLLTDPQRHDVEESLKLFTERVAVVRIIIYYPKMKTN